MGEGDVSQLNFDIISDLCIRYLRGQVQSSTGTWYTFLKVTKLAIDGVTSRVKTFIR